MIRIPSAGGFAFLEHTADVGIRAWGPSISDAFEQAGVGLATLMGATAEPSGRTEPVHVEGVDLEGLLVAFLNELIYLFEIADGEGLASLKVTRLEPTSLDADVQLAPMDTSGEGLLVKAATYHQLEVSERPDGTAEARVYLDV